MKRDLDALARREHDVLVIGGGVYGAAAAWDAAQRGLQVALLEAEDFGSGTSWNSLKTIHGGLRYLQSLDFPRMRESISDRRALLRIAPKVVRPLPFIVATSGVGLRSRLAFRAALFANDLVSADRNAGLPPELRIPPGRLVSRDQLAALFPGLATKGLSGGALWTDAQVTSPERLILGFLLAAVKAGAHVANHLAVTGFLRAGRRIQGVRAEDRISGRVLEIPSRFVLNAAGPGMDDVLALAGVARARVPLLAAANLVLRRPLVGTHALGSLAGGRYLFLVPWRDRSIVGTAYAPAGTDRSRLLATFLEEAQRAFPWAGLVRDDVTLVHQGLVPGREGGGLSRRTRVLDHEVTDGLAGLLSVQGVKYTTARIEAQALVDRVFVRLGKRSPPCRTAVTLLEGAAPLQGSLGERAVRAVRDEMALRLTDAVLGRLDLGTAGPPPAGELAEVSAVLARELGWSAETLGAERRVLEERYRLQ